MGSPARTARFRRPLLGWSALLKADLSGLAKSWVLRGWLLALVLTTTVGLAGMLAGRAAPVPASAVVTAYLSTFLLLWSTVIIVLSAGSVSLEADIVADSLLSRACTRPQYLMAKLASRGLVTVGVYLVFAGIASYAAWRYAARDVTPTGVTLAVLIVGAALLLLCSLGITLSVLLSNTIASVVTLLLLWYVAAPVFSFLGAEYLSPPSLTSTLPQILRDYEAPRLVRCAATTGSLTLTFSEEMDPRTVERVDLYAVEEAGVRRRARTAAYGRDESTLLLGGLSLKPGSRVRVTARGVRDLAGNTLSPAAETLTAQVPSARRAGGRRAPRKASPVRTRSRDQQEAARLLRCSMTASSLRAYFTGPLDARDAERPERYVVESPPGRVLAARALTYDPASRSVTLTGLDLPPRQPVRVTVVGLRDAGGVPIPARCSSAVLGPVPTWKYLAGFGLPALLFAVLAMAWFSRRDL